MQKNRQKIIGFLTAIVLLSAAPTPSIVASTALTADQEVIFSDLPFATPVTAANCFSTVTPLSNTIDTENSTLHFDSEAPAIPLYQKNFVTDFNADDSSQIDLLWTDGWYFAAGTEIQFQASLPERLKDCAISGTLVNSRSGQSRAVNCLVINGSILSTVQIIESSTYRLILEDVTGKESFDGIPITYTTKVPCEVTSISSPHSSFILCSANSDKDAIGQETVVNKIESAITENGKQKIAKSQQTRINIP